jgi:hypothetical protein
MAGKSFPRSEIGTKSARMSALEDLLERSLHMFSGVWGKFHYLCSLRENSGRYEHWGFIRTHGDTSAQAAFAEVHTALFSRILRTPLQELLEDVEISAEKMSVSTSEFLSGIRHVAQQSTPQNLAGGTLAHFNSVLDALSLVHSAQKNLAGQGALPRQLPSR